jgi:sec-independent protein translocase protein TatC
MALNFRRGGGKRKSKFQRAADGSMTLMEHLQDLRTRLVVAILVILVGTGVAMVFSQDVIHFLAQPYCQNTALQDTIAEEQQPLCNFNLASPVSHIGLWLKVSLYMALVATSPVWLYQLWAFIAPGLHRNERRYAYMFIGVAAPLFIAGAFLAYFVVNKGLEFIMVLNGEGMNIALDLEKYINFFLGVMVVFGLGFEFPLLMLMLNVVGLVSGKRMLGWWRVVVFMSFLFTAVFTPTPDPFGMTALAICMLVLYLGACGIAMLNDKRRGRNDPYAGLADDEAGDIGSADDVEAAAPVSPVDLDTDDHGPSERRNRLGRRVDYDDVT